MITFILLQVGCQRRARWECPAMSFPSRRTGSTFPFRSLLQLLDESCALKTMSGAATICNHITSKPMTGGFVGLFVSSVLQSGLWTLTFGSFGVPEGIACLFRYELRACQIACFIKAAVAHTQPGRTMYRLLHLARRLFLLPLQKCFRVSLISGITLFPLCATLPGISDSLPLPLLEPQLKPRIRRQSS